MYGDVCHNGNSKIPEIKDTTINSEIFMKIAMVGASGFVGTRLLGLLREEPFNV